jgi:NodT family efflux transporter outer membrane factor (OMF) lipoprotein
MIHQNRLCSVILFITFILSGCAKVGPDFHPPKVDVSPNWLGAGDQRVKTESSVYRNWWKTFNDPVLDGLINRAYRDNLSLRIAGVRVLEARAQLGVIVGEWYPQTQQASGSLQYNRVSESSLFASAFPKFDYNQAQVGINAAWELDFWGKFRRGIESADASLLAAAADYDNALVSLTADVATSYILIRILEERLRIAHENVEIQKENLKIAQARLRYGVVSELDVEQAKTVLNNTLASIPALETQLQQAKNALCLLLGLPPSDLTNVLAGASGIPVAPPQVVVGIPNDLLRRRPDISSAELQAAAQCAQIGLAKADLYPAFSLSGSFGFLATDVGNSHLTDLFQWGSRNYFVGPSFQWNLFNYGRITNNVRVQDARFEDLLITYQNAVLKGQREVEDSLVGFLRAQDQAAFLTQSTTAARKALDIAVLQYREGIKDFTTVLVVQQALLNEQNNLASALGNISSNLVGVYRALGGGWEIREGRDLVPPEVKEAMEKRTNWGRLPVPASYNPPASQKPEFNIRPPDW